MDMKDWTSDRADSIAIKKYGKGYYELPDYLRRQVWDEAEQDWIDKYSSELDAAYHREQDRRTFELTSPPTP